MIFERTLIVILLCVSVSFRNDLPSELVQGFVNGDAKLISKHFNESIELIFTESSGVYGKTQAEQILRTFFVNNAPANGKFGYKPLHNSGRENMHYFIGELHTGKGLYRVTIHMKDKLIHRMRIENND